MPAPILTVAYLKRRLRWEGITLERGDGCAIFHIHPSNEEFPTIDIGFDYDIQFIDSVEYFWPKCHGHYERWESRRKNVVDAIRVVDRLVNRKSSLVECLDSESSSIQSEIVTGTEVPEMIANRSEQFRRTFFDRAAQLEPVPWQLYLKREHHFISKTLQAELDEVARKLAQTSDTSNEASSD